MERHISVWLPLAHPLLNWGPDLVRDPGICPDWELNQLPFGLQAGTQSTEPHTSPGSELELFLFPPPRHHLDASMLTSRGMRHGSESSKMRHLGLSTCFRIDTHKAELNSISLNWSQ